MTNGSSRIVLDDSLEEGKWRSDVDFKTKCKIILVAKDIFVKIEDGFIPDEILKELKVGGNGSSPV